MSKHHWDGPIDLSSLDLRSRRALVWAAPCVKSEAHYGCGAAAYTPCLHGGEAWHSYRELPGGVIMINITCFPFHSARWHAGSKINMLEALAIMSRDDGPIDPSDMTTEESIAFHKSLGL